MTKCLLSRLEAVVLHALSHLPALGHHDILLRPHHLVQGKRCQQRWRVSIGYGSGQGHTASAQTTTERGKPASDSAAHSSVPPTSALGTGSPCAGWALAAARHLRLGLQQLTACRRSTPDTAVRVAPMPCMRSARGSGQAGGQNAACCSGDSDTVGGGYLGDEGVRHRHGALGVGLGRPGHLEGERVHDGAANVSADELHVHHLLEHTLPRDSEGVAS